MPNNLLQNQYDNNTPMQTIYNITNMFNEHDYENKHENQHFTKTDPYWLSKKNFSLQKLMQTKGGKSNQKHCKIQWNLMNHGKSKTTYFHSGVEWVVICLEDNDRWWWYSSWWKWWWFPVHEHLFTNANPNPGKTEKSLSIIF